MFKSNNRYGFTLIELLISVGILALLAVISVVILNPQDYLSRAKDAKRVAQIDAIDKALSIAEIRNADLYFGEKQVVYTSLPDTDINCASYSSDLVPLPNGWRYNCVAQVDLRKVDGNGWIPVNLASLNFFTLSSYPIDPDNDASQGLYYTYIYGSWEIAANRFSSEKYQKIYSPDPSDSTITSYARYPKGRGVQFQISPITAVYNAYWGSQKQANNDQWPISHILQCADL